MSAPALPRAATQPQTATGRSRVATVRSNAAAARPDSAMAPVNATSGRARTAGVQPRESADQPRATANSRADARRNRALVLAAAQRALAEDGVSVSLAQIARRAGVGAGTVYRHFPTKTALLEAVMQQRIDRLTGLAHRLRDAPDAGTAFFSFCTEVITSSHRNQAVCDMVSNDGWPRELVADAGIRFHAALGDLLVAAQRQGAVRPDVTLPDVLALYTGCVAIQRLTPDLELARPAAMVLDSLRALPSTDPVTKRRNPAAVRDETLPRNETPSRAARAMPHCPICTAPLRPTATGRPARYCSAACRQKAHRRRHAPQTP